MRRLLHAVFAFALLAVGFGASAQLPLDFRQFDKLEEKLQLTPDQKEQYDAAVGATKRMLLHMAITLAQAKERIGSELAKDRPDLNVLYDLRAVIEDGKPLRREARDEWRKFYAMLSEDQVAVLRRFVEKQLDVGMLHEFMMQLMRKPAS
jgi:hypothetical protein